MVGFDMFYRVPQKRFSPLKFHRHEIVKKLKEFVIEDKGKKILNRQDNLSLLRRKNSVAYAEKIYKELE